MGDDSIRTVGPPAEPQLNRAQRRAIHRALGTLSGGMKKPQGRMATSLKTRKRPK